MIISKTGCPNLRAGFLQKYVYKEIHTVTGTAYKDVPEKNHPYSDIQDCLQYAALLVSGGLIEMESEYDEALADLRRQRLIDERNRVSGY
ncbi:hypothetical protein GWN26_08945 [Candidatus Saccharibacteria bacterium]|nr:hypothetical protein [Candidatus Saccharibacteria bacterium]NIW79551.1 hypothetical protein [Calditrichia bacterium]